MQDLSFRSLVALNITDGATTPAPNNANNCWAWSTTLNRPVFWNNAIWRAIPNISVGTTAPSTPAVNDVWIDTN